MLSVVVFSSITYIFCVVYFLLFAFMLLNEFYTQNVYVVLYLLYICFGLIRWWHITWVLGLQLLLLQLLMTITRERGKQIKKVLFVYVNQLTFLTLFVLKFLLKRKISVRISWYQTSVCNLSPTLFPEKRNREICKILNNRWFLFLFFRHKHWIICN